MESKFKYLENLDKYRLASEISRMGTSEKMELIVEIIDQENPSENNLRVAVVAYSQVNLVLGKQLVDLTEENQRLKGQLLACLKN